MASRGSNIYKRKDGRYEGCVLVVYRDNGSIQYKSVYARTLGKVKEKRHSFIQSYSNRKSLPKS